MRPFYASKTPKELRDCWGTPQWLFDRFNAEFPFAIDAAADQYNAKCALYLEDGLAFNWADITPPDMWVWNNPPFSFVNPWVKQWIRSADSGAGVVSIVNSQTGATWYHEAMEAASEVRLSKGRVAFIHPLTGKPIAGNNLGQTVFVFEPGKLGQQKFASFSARR